ncbi:hypothetical protein LC605_31810 [Nostoc sp. CHAB 5836]|uniref:hypothetical protein n=1 Tax=Nostoc sp. CHAB 5836 TaxID=2780404 RepID=UPI001E55E4B2|nr:hypothetical protein [Nostoc sp. CHAB 5836]MCC5619556.1 hypothetical protein [Nostoc sp. CHAB 5836]
MQFDTWLLAAIDAYKFSRSSAKILAWTNNRINTLNQQIRIKTYRIEVKNDLGKEARLSMIHPDDWDLINFAVAEAKKGIFQLPVKQRSHAWREYYEFLETYNLVVKGSLMHRLQYGYAITVHQSQGGTFCDLKKILDSFWKEKLDKL